MEQTLTLASRKMSVLKSIESQDLLTAELTKAVLQAVTIQKVEDLYLPYKPKRNTKGAAAREAGAGKYSRLACI